MNCHYVVKNHRMPNLMYWNFILFKRFWTGTVKTVPTKLLTKIVGTDLSVPGLNRGELVCLLQ